MKIRYSLTLKECLRLERWRNRQCMRVPRARVTVYAIFALIIGANVICIVDDAVRKPYYLPADFLLYLYNALMYLILLPLVLAADWLLNWRGQTLEIGPDEIVLAQRIHTHRAAWRFVSVVEETADALYIFIRQRSLSKLAWGVRTLTILVPRRAFASDGDAQQFFEQAQSYSNQADADESVPIGQQQSQS